MEKYLCIHGHFYQPPRENPWLDAVERQDSAYPYHDWNERITAECYAPNAAARRLGAEGRITEIVNNYSRMSFNFGPTLLSWLEKTVPNVYAAVLEADRLSQERFSGHGAAIAQVYNHMIMPLANRQDKETQVIWGIRDFEHRFKRKPEGMWLSETAVDIETLEVLAENDITFTILAAHQAKQVRKIGEDHWQDVSGSKVDPRLPYRCTLPSGKTIILFFYDNPAAHDVAFGPLLKNGEHFAQRLIGLFGDESSDQSSQLVHIATDGETYGHHHRYGDMALAYCLNEIEEHQVAKVTIYGEYLEKHPVENEAEIFENTSWSCFHGVERWRSDCGCNSGLQPGSNQAWRKPLREALDSLRDDLQPIFEKNIKTKIADPWAARNDYIDVILDRSEENVKLFLEKHNAHVLAHPEQVKVLKLLEMQRFAMLMYTSCGWFFDELSGIETLQVMQYAARAMQLAQEVADVDLKKYFIEHMQEAKSNVEAYADGRAIWLDCIEPTITDLNKVSAHYAVESVFSDKNGKEENIYCYTANWEVYEDEMHGSQRLVTGRMRVQSDITRELCRMVFCVLHFGEHNLAVGVRDDLGDDQFGEQRASIMDAFNKGQIPQTIRLIDDCFEPCVYTLGDLFKDEQRKLLNMIMQTAMEEAEVYYRHIYENHYPIIQIMHKKKLPLPKILSTTVEFVLNTELVKMFEQEEINVDHLNTLVDEMKRWEFKRDKTTLQFHASQAITRLMKRFEQEPENLTLLGNVVYILLDLRSLELHLNIWQAQNVYHEIDKTHYLIMQDKAEAKDLVAQKWIALFERLGAALRVEHSAEDDKGI
jgi:alpha-amylase/alpha-mannosidase (GH57 family)